MNYEEICVALACAWDDFDYKLSQMGFTEEQLVKLETLLVNKDVYSAVIDAVVEVTHE
jgi:hypothetical protein